MTRTNLQSQALKGAGEEGTYDTILFIEMVDANGQLVFFSAVTQYGEVDSYCRMFSRLMSADYSMNPEDVTRLYSLLPEEIHNELLSTQETPAEAPTVPKKNYTVWIFVGVAFVVFAIAFNIGYRKYKRMNG